MRKPTVAKLTRMINQESWKSNVPKIEEVIEQWKPAAKLTLATDPTFIKCMTEQSWTELTLKNFGPELGQGERL